MVNPVGSVTAEIILDTSKFEDAVKALKGEVDSIKESFNKKTGGNNGLLDDVKKLKSEIDSLREKNENYKKTLKELREQNADYAKSIENLNKKLEQAKKENANFTKELKNEQVTLDNVTKSNEKYVNSLNKRIKLANKSVRTNLGRGTELDNQVLLEGFKFAYLQYNNFVKQSEQQEKESWQRRTSTFRNASETYVNLVRILSSEMAQSFATSETGMTGYMNVLSRLSAEFGHLSNANSKASDNIYKNGQLIRSAGESWQSMFSNITASTSLFKTEMYRVKGELVEGTKWIGNITDVLKTFDFQLLASADETRAYTRALQLASDMQRMVVQGTKNWAGRNVTGGYSTYLSQIKQINEELTRQQRIAKETKLANEGLSQAYNQTGINLNTYKANLTQIDEALEKTRLRTAQLEAAQQSLYYKNAPNNLGTYKANMQEINAQLERQLGIHKKTGTAIKNSWSNTKGLGSQIQKSGEYANALYRGFQKVRSIIISIRTIAGALGAMAIWNFAFDLVDKAKETYKAKNEMETLLAKNSHVDVAGQNAFNKALDKTVQRFQKINKYSLGETAASVGLEFDLNGKEMAKSLGVIAMVQNEYVRAGRTTEEAALAVKDILQGEFQRLSRETGIGKEELKDFGWNGKKDDVQSLMDALEKAGKARHWDLFAEKATSVGDVVTITQSRFSEFGANLITEIEPMIVGAFNGMIGAIDGISKAFNSMDSFGKMATIGLGGTGALVGATSLFMSLSKGIGLADIATIGFFRSIGSLVFKLNTAKVAQYGFLKTLMASISGTDAATVANVRFSKVLAGRLLGVKQESVATHGLLSAMVARRMELKGELNVMNSSIVATGNLRQKLIYLAKGEIVANKEGATYGRTLKALITSTKLWRIAIMGIVSIGLIAWLSSVYTWSDRIKKNITKFNTVLSDGDNMVANAKKKWDDYEESLSKATDTTSDYYKRLKANRDVAKGNYNDLVKANKLAKQYDYEIKQYGKSIITRKDDRMTATLQKAGLSYADATENVHNYTGAVEKARSAELRAYQVEDARLIEASKYIDSRIAGMKKEDDARVAQVTNEKERVKLEKELTQKRVDYAQEYTTVAMEAAEHWKEFYKGNISAGLYALGDELRLVFVDLWNNNHFRTFWLDLQDTWKTVKPTVDEIIKRLGDLGNGLLDLGHSILSTDIGKWTASIAVAGVGIAGLAYKFRGTISTLKDLGKSIWGRIKDFRKLKDTAEETAEKTSTTGGVTGDVGTVGGKTTGKLSEDLKNIGKNRLKSFTNNALILVEGMALVTEAILLIKAPMWALSEVGKDFKVQEPQIREGIEGLKLVSPVIGAILIPILAIHQVLSRTGKFMSSWGDLKANLKAMATMMLGIAEGMFLVTEAIYLLKMPLWSLGEAGKDFLSNKANVNAGVEAMKTISDSLQYLLPFVPALAGGLLLAIAVFESGPLGGALTLAVIGGVALGIGLVAEAILALKMPLWSIGELGKDYKNNLSDIKKGAEAIKTTAEAMTSLAVALSAMLLVKWDIIANAVTDLIGIKFGADLTKLTEKDGFFDQLEKFTTQFNDLTITSPTKENVDALNLASEGLNTVGDALTNAKKAIDNIPPELKDPSNLSINDKYQKNVGGKVSADDEQGYFDSLFEPLKQLSKFIKDFNSDPDLDFGEGISQDKIDAITSASSMLEQVNSAVTKVRDVIGNSILTNGMNNLQNNGFAFGGAGAIAGLLQGAYDFVTGSGSNGDYVSSLGSSFKGMEDIIHDLSTFSSNVSQYTTTGGDSSNVESLATFVEGVSTQIGNLKSALSDNIPAIKDEAHNLGSSIVTGIKTGLKGIDKVGAYINSTIANGIMLSKDMPYNTANSLGSTTAKKFKEGVDPMSDYMTWEMFYVNKAMSDYKDDLGQTAHDLASYVSSQYKSGLDMNSPGLMARTTQEEVGYIGEALSVNNLPQMAFDLANSLSSNFKLDFGLSNIQLPDITQFTGQLNVIPSTIANIKTRVTTDFTNIKTNIGGAFQNIVANTRTNMAGMQSSTVKHIGNIKSSWRGMQDALIASAEHIRSQTKSKIDKLKSNLGDFWNKVKHPDQLIGGVAGGKPKGTIRRRSVSLPKGNYAGSGLFKRAKSTTSPSDYLKEALECELKTGKPCYAGWSFDWTDKIQNKFNGWNTHFNKYNLDSHLNVGKFRNSNFPVRGIASVAKDYIADVIKSTSYELYFNQKYGTPAEALRAGSFNCFDGTRVVLALAEAFGFGGGSFGHGTWDGTAHVWANIPGLGIIDPTALQQRGSFKSSAVNYGGSPSRSAGSSSKVVHNHGDTVVNINAPVYGVEDLEDAIERGVNKANRRLFRNNYSGV